MTWQPIATAPLDVPILVWLPAEDIDGLVWSAWPAIICTNKNDDTLWISVAEWLDNRQGVCYSVTSPSPTHWMPYPGRLD